MARPTLTHDPVQKTWQINQMLELPFGLGYLSSWNSKYKRFSRVRTLDISNELVDTITRIMQDPRLRLYSVLSHTPMVAGYGQVAEMQQIVIDGEPYIDEFGYHVYIAYGIGYQDDIDTRYPVGMFEDILHKQFELQEEKV